MTTYKDTIRSVLADSIDTIYKTEDLELRGKALLGVKKVLDEFVYDLSLLIGECNALKEIQQ